MPLLTALLIQIARSDVASISLPMMQAETEVIGDGLGIQTALVRWKEGEAWKSQVITTKPTWSFVNRQDWLDHRWSRPAFGVVQGSGTPIIWTLNTVPSGVYEYAAVRFLTFKQGSWNWIPIKGRSAEFSGRGTFWIEGSWLLTCDYQLDDQGGHLSPMPYRFTSYRVTEKSVTEASSRVTKGRYAPEMPSGEIPESVLPNNDPMREFGRTWKWWGPKLNGGR